MLLLLCSLDIVSCGNSYTKRLVCRYTVKSECNNRKIFIFQFLNSRRTFSLQSRTQIIFGCILQVFIAWDSIFPDIVIYTVLVVKFYAVSKGKGDAAIYLEQCYMFFNKIPLCVSFTVEFNMGIP